MNLTDIIYIVCLYVLVAAGETLIEWNRQSSFSEQTDGDSTREKAIVSPFLRTLSSSYLDLTPRETQIATLDKDGNTTKEITDHLNISATAVDFHRKNLRSKFGIKNKRTNLRSYLASLSA
jgi:DNA-binding CsgD family transcriptional regulator